MDRDVADHNDTDKAYNLAAALFGAFSYVALLDGQGGLTWRRAVSVILVGSSFAVFVAPWMVEMLSLETHPHAAYAVAYLVGMTGMVLARTVVQIMETHALGTLKTLLDRWLGQSPGGKDRSEDRPDGK